VTMGKKAAALTALALVLTGAGAAYLFMRSHAGSPEPMGAPAAAATATPRSGVEPTSATAAPRDARLPEVVVSLTPEVVERAGIAVRPVRSGTSAGGLRLPGVIEPNAYRKVAVTPLVAGRVTRVSAELGAGVRRGQTLARIYSPELAEAQTKYVSARAMLDAHEREVQRTEKLVGIGAASRQEMERIHAEHAAQTAAVQSARSQLELLGVPAPVIDALRSGSDVDATTLVPAPIDGVVTERVANVGLNVDQATPLFTVVDLSTVWTIADVYEKDLSRVRVGDDATVTTAAYPGLSVHGRITYIDPQVNPETRTAKVRVEVPNPRGDLRLGMYADVVVTGTPGASMPVIDRTAVQNVGHRTVVYVANPKERGQFTEREVRLGEASGEQVEIASGVQLGDLVVTEGSFFVRAERERLGPGPAATTATRGGAASGPPASGGSRAANVQTAKIVVNEQGFAPANIPLRAGIPARLTFIRTTDKSCATEVAFPSLSIKRPLPLNEPVVIEFTPSGSGEVAFACGMNMLKGAVAVQ
jgi:RND family efflux transporter MFP subunit